MEKNIKNAVTRFFLFLLNIYRSFLSAILPSRCRFFPSCSCYAIEAVQQYGLLKGFYLITSRLLKCHPFHPGGYDPVPKIKE